MKAEILMIGDWVLVKGVPTQVYAIIYKGINPRFYGISDEIEDYVHEEDIEPIPLTPEILEKNGFEVSSEHARYYFEEDGEKYEFVLRKMYYINDRKKQKGWSFYSFNVLTIIDYVHELQHALKLCGIEKEIVL